jgi:Aspartyl protease
MKIRAAVRILLLRSCVAAFAAGCALYSDVEISPLPPQPIDAHPPITSVEHLTETGDYLRAIAAAQTIEQRRPLTGKELAALGSAELAAQRLDDARRHLRAALDFHPFRTDIARIAWDLSQTEYMANNFAAAAEWAAVATEHGLSIRDWHLKYVTALSNVDAYRVREVRHVRLPIKHDKPDVPRLTATINGRSSIEAVIDSGAALSIISETLARDAGVRTLGNFDGTFYGLLEEPIKVHFGIIDRLELGEMVIENVPVAIMNPSKMSFLSNQREKFNIDFLIGAHLLKEFRVELDYAHGMISLTHRTALTSQPSAQQNLFFVGSRPMVHATVNNKGNYLLILDTGSEITFLNESELQKTNLRALPKMYGATLQGLGGSYKRGSKIEGVQIGVDRWAGSFRHLPLYRSDKTSAFGILGANFLKKFVVVIDFGTMRVDLIKPNQV